MGNTGPMRATCVHAVKFLLQRILNERGEVVIPFLEAEPEERRPAISNFVTGLGATTEDLASFKTFDEFLGGYKPKAPTPAPDWISTLPPEHKAVVDVKGFKTPADAIKHLVDVEKFVGYDKIPAPRKDKDGNYEKGELERVFSALGLPKGPEGYALPKDFKAPEGIEMSGEMVNQFKVAAHKLGILPNQFNGLMSYFVDYLGRGQQARLEANEKQYNDTDLKLRTKWGANYDARKNMANRVMQLFADKEEATAFMDKFGNDPMVISLMSNVGEVMSEETLQRAGITGSLVSPEVAADEIRKVESDPKHPYFVREHPQHAYWVQRMTELYKMKG